MGMFGYLLAIIACYLLYDGALIAGLPLFFIGGFLSGNLKISISSLGIMMMIGGGAYGVHYEFTPAVIITMVVGFILSGLGGRSGGWEIDLSDIFDSGSDSGGDSGGGGGGD